MNEEPKTKQISIYFTVEEFRAIRLEAARKRLPMNGLLRKWIDPKVNKLKDQS